MAELREYLCPDILPSGTEQTRMASGQPDRIDMLAVMLVDLRASIDAQKRCVVSAQASAEEYRAGRDHQSLDDIAHALAQMTEQARAVADGLREAGGVLRGVQRSISKSTGSSEPSAV